MLIQARTRSILVLGPWSWSLVLGLCSYEHIFTTGSIQRMGFQKQPAPRVSAYLSGVCLPFGCLPTFRVLPTLRASAYLSGACFTGGCVPGPAWGPWVSKNRIFCGYNLGSNLGSHLGSHLGNHWGKHLVIGCQTHTH